MFSTFGSFFTRETTPSFIPSPRKRRHLPVPTKHSLHANFAFRFETNGNDTTIATQKSPRDNFIPSNESLTIGYDHQTQQKKVAETEQR